MIRLLLVDDDPLILLAAGAALRADGGFDVREAATAADALALAAREPFDALVTDVQLPDMDGPALLDRLRAAEGTRELPVVFLTGTSAPAELDRLRASGARGLLAKPFDPLRLAGELRRLLGD